MSGHSFGNLFLAALAGITGDFLEAIKVSSEVLAIKGRIFPSTVQDVALVAELVDGRVIRGETNIVESRSRIKRLRLSSDMQSASRNARRYQGRRHHHDRTRLVIHFHHSKPLGGWNRRLDARFGGAQDLHLQHYDATR